MSAPPQEDCGIGFLECKEVSFLQEPIKLLLVFDAKRSITPLLAENGQTIILIFWERRVRDLPKPRIGQSFQRLQRITGSRWQFVGQSWETRRECPHNQPLEGLPSRFRHPFEPAMKVIWQVDCHRVQCHTAYRSLPTETC